MMTKRDADRSNKQLAHEQRKDGLEIELAGLRRRLKRACEQPQAVGVFA
jgi:hypothetical protein